MGDYSTMSTAGRLRIIAVGTFFVTLPLAATLTLNVGFPVTIAHVAGVAIVALLLASMLRSGDEWTRRGAVPIAVLVVAPLCIAYVISLVASLGVSTPDYTWAVGRFAPGIRSATKVLWLIGNIALMACVAVALRRWKMEQFAITALTVGAAAAGAYGLYQVVGASHGFYIPFLPGTPVWGWVVPRAPSTFPEPAHLAAFLAVVLPFALIQRPLGARRRLQSLGIALVVILIAGGLAATFSASGAVAAAVGVAALIVLRLVAGVNFGLRRMLVSLVAGVLLVGLLVPGAPYAVSLMLLKGTTAVDLIAVAPTDQPSTLTPTAQPSTLTPTAQPSTLTPTAPPVRADLAADSSIARVGTLQTALRMFASNPVLGVGPGNYGLRFPEFHTFGPDRVTGNWIVNNIYAEVLAESGLLGFAAFLFAILALGFLLVRAMRREAGDHNRQLTGAIASLAALLATFVWAPSFTTLYQWAIIGLAFALISQASEAAPLRRDSPPAPDVDGRTSGRYSGDSGIRDRGPGEDARPVG
jgi:branched-subunit amino acid transport protein AzlD